MIEHLVSIFSFLVLNIKYQLMKILVSDEKYQSI